MNNREVATNELLKFIDGFTVGNENAELYKKRLDAMSDKEFDAFMGRLEREEEVLSLYIPTGSNSGFSYERLNALADTIGYEFFQHLYLTDAATGQTYRTPNKHLVLSLPVRRQVQMLSKKANNPENNAIVDERSGQPANESKGASVSLAELQILAARGLDDSIKELIKVRGGDTKAYQSIEREISEFGEGNLARVDELNSKPESVNTLSAYLTAAGLSNRL